MSPPPPAAAPSPLRIGVLSTAKIAHVFCAAVATFPASQVVVTAVASRTRLAAATFAGAHAIPATCTYDDLLASPDIDAVYIPLPTGLATPYAVRAASAGKHVLVDKPFDSAAGASAIAAAAAAAGVAFLDGTHFVHAVRTRRVLEAAAELGAVTHVAASFTHPVDVRGEGAIRGDAALEPAGALGDVGWYCFRAAVAAVGAGAAGVSRARCVARVGPRGVVEAAAGAVEMTGGATLSFDCGFGGPCRQRWEVVTAAGSVVVDDFVLPLGSSGAWDAVRPAGRAGSAEAGFRVEQTCEAAADGGVSTVSWPSVIPVPAAEGGSQAAALVGGFLRLAAAGAGEERKRWADEAVATQRMVDACLADARRP